MSQYSLRLPEDLYNRAADRAKNQGVSLNQFFLYAIASTVASLESRDFFEKRIAGRNEKDLQKSFNSLLGKVSSQSVIDPLDSFENETA